MAAEILSLSGNSRECRADFCAPPQVLLVEVFERLAGDGRLLSAKTSDGTEIYYPVVLQVEELSEGALLASDEQSGLSLFQNLVSIRNGRDSGIFLTLRAPETQVSDSHESTRKPIGIASVANEGGSSISTWWHDSFIQEIVEKGLGKGDLLQLEQAKRLLYDAIVSADAVDQHAVSRPSSWNIINRLWQLRDTGADLDFRVSLAAGFPPSGNSEIDFEEKSSILRLLVDRFESANMISNFHSLREERISNADENEALKDFQLHIRRKCDVVTSLKRSMSFFYAPDVVDPPPRWWTTLTVQRWLALLEEDVSNAEISITCTNALAFQVKGLVPVVRNTARIYVHVPEELEDVKILVTRVAPGGEVNKRQWILSTKDCCEFEDESIPLHKSPIKYIAEAIGINAGKATIKVIALDSWELGLIVCSRTAHKVKVPKLKSRALIETTLELSGGGRHYLDLYARTGVKIVSLVAMGKSDEGAVEPARIGHISEEEFGMEVEVEGERFYEFDIQRPESKQAEKFRICLLADESAAEECNSYFEFHLARNVKREGERIPRAVFADNQARSAQLQGWILDTNQVERSFYPFVLAPDYAVDWRRRDWSSASETIFSGGKFLNDPRPDFAAMRPPMAFIEARKSIAEKVRGKDGNDLIESANLGELLATDKEFDATLDKYIRAYLDWLSSSPEDACWCDIGIVMGLESDGVTFDQVPDAIVVSPLHPIRFAWQCLAQRAMHLASRKLPCPAASIMDPNSVLDTIILPLRDATGGISNIAYFSVECNSDYWGILWNTNRLDRLVRFGATPPLDREMGLLVGGISSGFSVSQVHRAMDDICGMLVAKPVIGVLVSSAAGLNSACNEGILSWGFKHFSEEGNSRRALSIGVSEVQVFDERGEDVRPNDAEISNLAEDTSNAFQWYSTEGSTDSHDLAIIAQLETSNASALPTKLTSSLGIGGLVRAKIREQQKAGGGQFLCESRVAGAAFVSGDGIADNVARSISRLEGWASSPLGYVFAPSMNAIEKSLGKAQFVAVSSSTIDPACFLGNWLQGTYLWDYELPSYSSRSGDSNGYYLLSTLEDIDIDMMKLVLKRLPRCEDIAREELSAIVQEVARRGIPTVRGLSAGNTGATGDLGLFIATRLLQDSFRASGGDFGLLSPWQEKDGWNLLTLIIPVDPFQPYLDDLSKAIKKQNLQRPDLVVIGLAISDSSVLCKLTPIEVKNRSGDDKMSSSARLEALGQAKSLSTLLQALLQIYTDDQELVLWRLAYQHLIIAMVEYGFRVYSQHIADSGRAADWSQLHSRVMESTLSSSLDLEIDDKGRLIVIDGTTTSGAVDTDCDMFRETIELSQADASLIVRGQASTFYQSMKEDLGDWGLLPVTTTCDVVATNIETTVKNMPVSVITSGGAEAVGNVDVEQPSDGLIDLAVQVLGTPLQLEATSIVELVNHQPADEAEQTGLRLKVGRTLDRFQSQARQLNLGHTALNQMNMGVVGDLGTGKTQLLKSLVYQIAGGRLGNRGVGPNVLIFDYKKDYSSDDFVAATGARVIRPQHLPLNLFDLSASSQGINPWLERYRFFADVLDKIYPGIGPVQRDRLKNAIKDSYKTYNGAGYPTIYDVQRNYIAALKGGADSLSGILGDIIDMELFTEDRSCALAPEEFFNGVVVIALNDLGQDDRTKNMLVAIMLNIFYERMLKIPKRPFLGKDRDMRVVDSMLLVDEADNIMQYEFDVLRKVLLQGREFGVGVILSSQYLSHFKAGGTDYREMLLTWFLHKVPNVAAKDLSPLGLSDASALPQVAERIKALNLHECLYKTHDVMGEFLRGTPFYELIKDDPTPT